MNEPEEIQTFADSVSPLLFGTNLEHTRSSVYYGIGAELLRNRKFSGKPGCGRGNMREWFPIGDRAYLTEAEPYTRHAEAGYRMRRSLESWSQQIQNFNSGETAGIGQHGLPIFAGTPYDFAVVLKANRAIPVTVRLTNRAGDRVYAQNVFTANTGDFTRYACTLTPDTTDNDADVRLTFDAEGYITVGALSLMPSDNFLGMRKDVIKALKALGVRLLRWPGGNFAGEYCWMDGLLPRDKRTPSESFLRLETQPHTMGYDANEIGTDEFIALCREIGAEPYITLNVTWMTPEENAAWVEYCNGTPDTEWGKIRAGRGHREPYNVHLWTLGNEAGYGHMEGDNTPEGYARIAAANASAIGKVAPGLTLCASGPYPHHEFAEKALPALKPYAGLISLHHYAPAFDYTAEDLEAEYEKKLAAGLDDGFRKARETHSDAFGIPTSFDEWNVWYAWYRPSSVYEGIFTAMMLHGLIAEAKENDIAVACHFEAVNEGLITVTPDAATLTAAGQMYAMISRHAGGRLIYADRRTVVTEKDGVLTTTFVNPSYNESATLSVAGKPENAVLHRGESILPYTRFAECAAAPTAESETGARYTVPPLSVIRVTSR